MQIRLSESTGIMKIAGDAGIADVEELRTALCGWSERADTLTVDLSEIGRCDASMVQLLVALGKSAAGLGKTVNYHPDPEVAERLCAEIGVTLVPPSSPLQERNSSENPAKSAEKEYPGA